LINSVLNELKLGGPSRLKDYFTENVAFDHQHGTDTCDWVKISGFINPPANITHGVQYRASYTSIINDAFAQAAKILPEAKSFFDIGCGKGKAVIMAALTDQFNRIVGIEYHQPFIDTAQDNFKKTGTSNIKILNRDASYFTDFDENSIIYMYNPFDKFIMDKVRRNIEENTRKAVIAYNKPLHMSVFTNHGWDVQNHFTNNNEDRDLAILTHGI